MARPLANVEETREDTKGYSVSLLEEEDIERAIDVWLVSFGFTDRERWRSFALDVSDVVVAGSVDGVPHSLATVIMFDMHLGDRWVKAGGIAGVACDPPYRRHGLVRMVLAECIRQMHDKGVALSGLWPFSYPFYARMGWAPTDMQHIVTHDLASIRTPGDSRAYKQVKLSDVDSLVPIHEKWISQFNLSMRRTEERWKRQLSRPDRTPIVFRHDDGYMIWNIKDPKERTLDVIEWAYTTNEAFLDGLALLKNAGDLHYSKASWNCPDLEPIMKLGVAYPLPSIQTRPGMMTRIVHLDAFLQALPRKVAKPEINDPLGITGRSKSNIAVGPGELLQIVTGFQKQPPAEHLKDFHLLAADLPSYSVEQY
ncbi:MAG TPA: GNAT family N-acetyltransferase [Candidatus Obscuribacterales bacterium]